MTKTIVKKEDKTLIRAQMLAQVLYDWELDRDAHIEPLKTKLKQLLRKMPKKEIKIMGDRGYRLEPYKKTEIKSEMAAQAWGLENPQARMSVQIAKVTKAFEGKPMPKWATRVHAEKLMPIKPKPDIKGNLTE